MPQRTGAQLNVPHPRRQTRHTMKDEDKYPYISKEIIEKIEHFKSLGHKVPPLSMIKSPEQIEGIRASSVINTGVLDAVTQEIRAGMSTQDIDKIVYEYTMDHGAIPAPLNYEGFPKSVCTSINDVVCHGIPNEEEILEEGDIINVDVSTIYKGYFSDASRMFIIGNTKPKMKKLVEVARECLRLGVEAAKPYGTLGDIGYAVSKHAYENKFSVVTDFCGHGVGLEFHEEPEVEHVGRRGRGLLIVPGMTFTIEPMINMGTPDVFIDEDDGWTVCTEDGKPSAQWEHTLLITETGNEILTY